MPPCFLSTKLNINLDQFNQFISTTVCLQILRDKKFTVFADFVLASKIFIFEISALIVIVDFCEMFSELIRKNFVPQKFLAIV